MWRFVGNVLVGVLFAFLATLAFAPLVMWLRPGTGLDQQNVEGLLAVAGVIFLLIAFTPKGRGSMRRGARITAFALLSMPIPLLIVTWQAYDAEARRADTMERISFIWLVSAPALALALIPVVIGLILLLVSRQPPAPKS